MGEHRARVSLALAAAASIAFAIVPGACGHDWDAFDPRKGPPGATATASGGGATTTSSGVGGGEAGGGAGEGGGTTGSGGAGAVGTGGMAGSGGGGSGGAPLCSEGRRDVCYSGPTGTAGTGACVSGTTTCQGGAWGPCVGEVTPAAESCNSLDDDCNGKVDDGGSDPASCGPCGAVCASGPMAPAICVGGVCKLACASGLGNCDGQAANGCETDITAAPNCGACGEACASGTCTTTLSTTFATDPPSWVFAGDAYHDGASGSAVLTDASTSLAGSLSFGHAIPTDSFVVSFELQIGGGTAADGLAFGLHQAGPGAVGAFGGGLGLATLPGFAFELDTYDNGECGDPGFEHAAISSMTGCANDFPLHVATSAALPIALRETGWHECVIAFDEGLATMSLDGVIVVGPVAAPGFLIGEPYVYAFGAGTGGETDRHEIRNVVLTFPTPRCL